MSDELPPADEPQPAPTCKETRMIARALSRRWPIPEELKEAMIKRQVAIAIDPKVKPRESTAAFRSLVAAEAQNQADTPPPEQTHTVTVKTDVVEAMEHIKDLPREEIERLAAAADIFDKVRERAESAQE